MRSEVLLKPGGYGLLELLPLFVLLKDVVGVRKIVNGYAVMFGYCGKHFLKLGFVIVEGLHAGREDQLHVDTPLQKGTERPLHLRSSQFSVLFGAQGISLDRVAGGLRSSSGIGIGGEQVGDRVLPATPAKDSPAEVMIGVLPIQEGSWKVDEDDAGNLGKNGCVGQGIVGSGAEPHEDELIGSVGVPKEGESMTYVVIHRIAEIPWILGPLAVPNPSEIEAKRLKTLVGESPRQLNVNPADPHPMDQA